MNALVMVMQTVGTMKTVLNAVSDTYTTACTVLPFLSNLLSMYIAVKQVINVSGTVDDSGLHVTWEQQPGSGYTYEVCYTDLSTATQTCENVTDVGSHTFVSATGTAVYQVTVKAFGEQMSAPPSVPIHIRKLQYFFEPRILENTASGVVFVHL